MTARIENIDKAVARTSLIVVLAWLLFCVRHINLAVEIADAKRRKIMRNVWVRETHRVHLMKVLIVRFHLPLVEICHVQKIVTVSHAQRRTLVNIVSVSPDRDNRVRAVERGIPSRDVSIFVNENESARLRVPIFCNPEEGSAVKDNAGWSPGVMPVFPRDGHDERIRGAVLVIEGGNARAIVAHPDEASRGTEK